jgi:two-component system, OmpR family, response regulator
LAAGSILIADDDAASRESVSALLRRAGYDATEAASGAEALQAALDEPPVLVILEVELPGMSGYDVCRALRDAFGETLPILLVSGRRTDPLDRVAGLLIGADDYLVKPLGATELLARIRRALTRANSCAGTRSRSPRSRL